MKLTNEITTTNENQVVSPNSGLAGGDVRTDITTMSDTADGTPTGSWGNGMRTLAIAALLAGGGSVTVSCTDKGGEVVTPVEVAQDTPEAKAAYMADVKPQVLGDGVATMQYDAVWLPTMKKYELQPKSMVDFAKAATAIEECAVKYGKNKESLKFGLYYQNSSTRIVWSIPYSLLKEMGGSQNLNSDAFDNLRLVTDVIPDGGNPDATIGKGGKGYLRVDVGNSNNAVIETIHEVNPYYFGK